VASSQPIVKQVSWVAAIPQLAVYFSAIVVAERLGAPDPLIFGIAPVFIYSISVRQLVPHHHRKGMSFFKKALWYEALKEFEASYEFFSNNGWIDHYRSVILMSCTRMSYREMALLNQVFCHTQIGNGEKAKDIYKVTLEQFPDSQIAQAALNFFSATEVK
jgi:tetratricopeptide (TPR) repeat protein